MSLPPLLFLQLLADRQLQPAIFVLHLGTGEPEALASLIDDENFAFIAAAFPCLIDSESVEKISPELLKALYAKGCRRMPKDALHLSNATDKPELPLSARWLGGNWYLSPPINATGNQSASRALSLKLLQLVSTDADTHEIENVFRQDPVLAYHLLRLVNSLGTGVNRHISSFSQAILILGRQQLKRWLNLMLFSANRNDYRSAMLMARVAVRARSMELLARTCGCDRAAQEQAFMAGMFSLLDTLFGMPLKDILAPLHLNETLTRAILDHEGEFGVFLQIIDRTECSDDTGLIRLLESINISPADFNLINLAAHQWMLGVIQDAQDTVDA